MERDNEQKEDVIIYTGPDHFKVSVSTSTLISSSTNATFEAISREINSKVLKDLRERKPNKDEK
jgi:hypothetical protein